MDWCPLHNRPLHNRPLHNRPLHDRPLHDRPLHSAPLRAIHRGWLPHLLRFRGSCICGGHRHHHPSWWGDRFCRGHNKSAALRLKLTLVVFCVCLEGGTVVKGVLRGLRSIESSSRFGWHKGA